MMAAALAALVTAPAIGTGLQLDDLLHRAALEKIQPYATWVSSPARLFRFFDGDTAHNLWLRSLGLLPWFAHPQLKVAFFRPVSAATHVADHLLFPHAPWAMHLHSIAWYAALAALVSVLYRRLIATPWVAGLAAVLYAVDDAHAIPAAWVANRNATVAATFAVLALILHDRSVRARALPIAAPIALALSLGAGETGVGVLAWLASYALVLDREPKRILRYAPYAIVTALWAFAWRASGAGSNGSALYTDPIAHPLDFLREAPKRWLLLAFGGLTNAPIDVANFLPQAAVPLLIASVLALIVIGCSLRDLLRTRPTARFFALGTILAMIPACGTLASHRLLMIASIGMFGLIAELVESASTALQRGFARYALFVHLAVSPILFLFGTQQFPLAAKVGKKFTREIPTDPWIRERDLIALNAGEPGVLPYLGVERALAGVNAPHGSWMLSITWQAMDVTRVDDRTLRLTPSAGFLADPLSGLVHDHSPMAVGVPIACGPFVATVTRVLPDGRAAEALFAFDRPLEDPGFYFVKFDGDVFRKTELPKIGETITLAATPLF